MFSARVSFRHRLKEGLISAGLYPAARFVYDHFLQREKWRAHRRDVALYQQLIGPGDLCFDGGAHVGLKSRALLDLGARVVALEPNPQCHAEIMARCGRNPNFTLVPSALGRRPGVATLHLSA